MLITFCIFRCCERLTKHTKLTFLIQIPREKKNQFLWIIRNYKKFPNSENILKAVPFVTSDCCLFPTGATVLLQKFAPSFSFASISHLSKFSICPSFLSAQILRFLKLTLSFNMTILYLIGIECWMTYFNTQKRGSWR